MPDSLNKAAKERSLRNRMLHKDLQSSTVFRSPCQVLACLVSSVLQVTCFCILALEVEKERHGIEPTWKQTLETTQGNCMDSSY